MKSISISIKLVFSNLIYIVPIVVLAYMMVAPYGDNIKFAEWEKKGNKYQAVLESMLKHFGEHSWLSQRALHGDKVSDEKIGPLDEAIEKDITLLDAVQSALGSDLQFTKEGLAQRKREHLTIENLRQEWSQLKSGWTKLKPEESIDKHAHLIADVRGMITHLGDTSNLILDPDLDSYYLVDITLGGVPQMQERLVDIITRGEGIVRRKKMSADDHVWIITAAAFLKSSDWERISGDAQTSVNEDKNFNGLSPTLQSNLPPGIADTKANVEDLLKKLEAIGADPASVEPSAFLASSEKCFTASFAFWTMASKELDILLQTRIDGQVDTRSKSLWFTFAALVAAAVISTFLGLSIRSGIVASISQIAQRLQQIAADVNSSNQKLVKTSQSLASGTTEQASALQETAATLDEISAMTQKSASSAEQSAREADETQKAAVQSRSSVHNLVGAISKIHESNSAIIESVTEGNKKIEGIVKMISEIGEKTKVINDIVFQTKLLSFNASVEAARAGEQGKGFAVVAEEVGNLAQMSGSAAKEISDLLQESTSRVTAIVNSTKENLDQVIRTVQIEIDRGLKTAEETEATLSNAVTKVENISRFVMEIAGSTREQAVGITEISKAMALLDQATQQNAGGAEQAASLVRELQSRADMLQSTIHNLQSQLGGKTAEVTTSQKAEVVSLPTPAQQEIPLKKAVGSTAIETPDRDHSGFRDV